MAESCKGRRETENASPGALFMKRAVDWPIIR